MTDKEHSIPNWSHLQTSFLQDPEAAGYPPESIDTVLCTHLHVDHVGWNTRLVSGEWVPTLPNATYFQHARITGDWSHHPCQMSCPKWCSSADSDAGMARETRESLLTRCADDPVLVIGTYFPTPAAGHVRSRSEGGYWLDVS